MLDRAKVIRELERVSDRLFADFSLEADMVRTVWKKIADDPTFIHKVRQLNGAWLVPTWSGRLDDIFPVEQSCNRYRVLAVDGSQIYPDRHQGTMCSLINVGAVHLSYGVDEKKVQLSSDPTVFVGDEDKQLNEAPQELINCRRQEFEFLAGLEHAIKTKRDDAPFLFS